VAWIDGLAGGAVDAICLHIEVLRLAGWTLQERKKCFWYHMFVFFFLGVSPHQQKGRQGQGDDAWV
jgi:hypothetical protein